MTHDTCPPIQMGCNWVVWGSEAVVTGVFPFSLWCFHTDLFVVVASSSPPSPLVKEHLRVHLCAQQNMSSPQLEESSSMLLRGWLMLEQVRCWLWPVGHQ
jgi:hypothetical protein